MPAVGVALDISVHSTTQATAVQSPLIAKGNVLQLLSRNEQGAVDGTAYMVISHVHGPGDATGRFVEFRHGG